jgi:hypothetical protein
MNYYFVLFVSIISKLLLCWIGLIDPKHTDTTTNGHLEGIVKWIMASQIDIAAPATGIAKA